MKDFFEKLNTLAKPRRPDIIEKDYYLHRILNQMAQDDYLLKNLVFKGGTCLVKAYTGYYRFSEDIDFTWQDTSIWKDRPKNQVVRRCSSEITKLISKFNGISKTLGMKFTDNKADTAHIHISSGGRMVIFFIDYRSEILNLPSKIKIEINFVDKTLYPFQSKKLNSYVNDLDSEEIKFLYTKMWEEYTKSIKILCYDPREIFLEKCRASITRKAYKLRDVIDIYYLNNKFGYTINKFKPKILDKIQFMLDLYERYQENIELIKLPEPGDYQNEEMKLLIITPPKDIGKNIENIHNQLSKLKNELLRD